MARVVIGLGSNVGDRLSNLRAAVARVRELSPNARASSVYETSPVGGPAQGDFMNAAVAIDWSRDLHELLDELQGIERDLGRARGERWGPRTIDLDVLWGEGVVISTPRLTVPHPRLHERLFALVPLLEVAPDARDARSGAPLVASATLGQSVRRLDLDRDLDLASPVDASRGP